ncbi:PREDICTED: ADP-ribose pyrophosphatase, mitochondrial [Chrysochloris asiatica]|uniref:ADP-ribose pyrophosphatase, mitochondrial n=1 Tax=Chrysochloris asiatica TaxID=185453 RepID=A0A9B0TUB1_CHRAS|nr:PREDICTED: ADP-ribose pyrophosphatase, mitochondrial [Chrysochloris asiatica]
MAGSILGKSLATLSLSVALASVSVRSLGCGSIPAYRNSFLSCWFHFNSVIMSNSNDAKENSHNKARTSPYPGSKVERSQVPNEKVAWLVEWQEYNPVEYTAVSVLAGPSWADPQISESNFSPKFNEKDGHVERKSKNGLYEIKNGRPRNPAGRTGLVGRGLLGRWGPNHAADPIITRWKRDSSGNKITHPVSGRNILQFVAIKRKDCGEWAIPGGMVDPGEKISATLKREFGEEALNSLQKSNAEKREIEKQLHKLFSQEHLVKPHKCFKKCEVMDNLTLEAGDDAGKVKWVDISAKLKLYASHSQFIKLVAEKREAHWSEDSDSGCPRL